ncbi:MAG: tetratricopeptide repeat protein [Oscillatoria sp. SIO1A7]|nr:tetratricopeptide repeat protein [Oscillatoria sp. SIO1A7]
MNFELKKPGFSKNRVSGPNAPCPMPHAQCPMPNSRFAPILALMLWSGPVAVAIEPEPILVAQDNSQTAPLLQQEGSLSPGDRTLDDGKLYDSYSFQGRAGQTVTISVESDEFDTYLTLLDADGEKIAENDDSAGNNNSAIVATLPEDGSYEVIVNSYNANGRGKYALEVRPATEADIRRAAADRLYQEAKQLRGQRTPESLRGARDKLEEALLIYRELGDIAGEALTIYSIGTVYFDFKDKQEALSYYNQALPLYRQAGDVSREATALNNVGWVYSFFGEKQEALSYYNRALPLYRQAGDISGEAITLNNIGKAYSDLGEKQEALSYYNRALPLSRQAGDISGEALTLNGIGLLHSNLGNKQKALSYYNRALSLYRQAGDISGEADTLNNIGAVYSFLGEKQEALSYYNQALLLSRQAGDISGEAVTLNSVGLLYSDLGEKQEALSYLNQALPLTRQAGYISGEATTLNDIGLVYSDLGDKQKALSYYNQSLLLSRQAGDISGEAITLSNIGNVYRDLGDQQQALSYLNQALPLAREAGNKEKEATVLHNLGKVHYFLGDRERALSYLSQALLFDRQTGYKAGEAATLNSIGEVEFVLGDKQQALSHYNEALPLSRQAGDKGREAIILNNIGEIEYSLGDPQEALSYLNQSLPLRRQTGDKGGEAKTLGNIAKVKRARGQLEEALNNIEAAIKIIENLRTKIASQELRTSYFAQNQDAYEFYIDLLIELHRQNPDRGYDGRALHASERARARSLLELLEEAGADIRTGVAPELREKERRLQQRINATASRQSELLSGEGDRAEAVNKELANLLRELEEVRGEIRLSSPGYAALTQPQPLQLEEIQKQILDEQTLLLQYSLGEERSYLWAVSKTGIATYELPGREEVEKAARNFRDYLTIPSLRIRGKRAAQIAGALSETILGPVASQLGDGQYDRLLIVSDGALNYIPFAALTIPKAAREAASVPKPLIVDYEIVNLPSASTLEILRRDLRDRLSSAPKTVAILADPVFDAEDDRVAGNAEADVAIEPIEPKEPEQRKPELAIRGVLERAARAAGIEWRRLPGTREEAKAIMALVPPGQRQEMLDFDASQEMAKNPELSQYRILHFATHGFANSENPELSGIVMSLVDENGSPQNGYLRLHDIYNLEFGAELVVLSACQTGLGKEIRGEGLVGLTRGFMYAGAPRVVVSLWSVEDRATAELMAIFYQKMLEENLAPAAALRAAQIEIWQQKEWQNPYYWAAFGLQGEWR